MKSKILKMILPLVALAVTAGSATLMSFGEKKSAQTNLHWYSRNPATGVYSYDRQATAPTNPCEGEDEVCAKGFTSMQANPNLINDNTPSQQTLFRAE
ncbi:hypothetical protein PQ465_20625 [Sphingobacterium oryzagri]|uniref:Uncharacterized protein n=1 Tax=Sphingobacterium oryzagri TaxID=3025669 RepID=A0ABY7WGN2_9SPHI|nr:hypothetical protein [Sphingobacterium sp. KACC 22765]WDF68687.1 hypothetical protein PQ465_20625 [Sphingobacterium sp. KACC 22765]